MLNPPLARLDAELPPGAKVLLVGQAAVFHLDHPIVYNTVFNRETIETLARGRSPERGPRGAAPAGASPTSTSTGPRSSAIARRATTASRRS